MSSNAPKLAPKVKLVGVVGLGRMGSAFAANLAKGGFQVIGYDQFAKAIEGVKPAAKMSDLASCDAIVTSLPNDAALTAVALSLDGLVSILKAGAVHISMSSVSPELSREIAAAHEAKGQQFVAAPVLGNPDLAKAQKLFLLVSGKNAAVESVTPVLEKMGQQNFMLGEDPGTAALFKAVSNTMTAVTLQIYGECLALLAKAGIDKRVANEIFTSTMFDGKVHKAYGGKIVDERYLPAGMQVPFAVKDLRLALAEAEILGVPMPIGNVTHDRLVAMVGRGWASLDWSGLGLQCWIDAGLESKAVPTATTTEPHL